MRPYLFVALLAVAACSPAGVDPAGSGGAGSGGAISSTGGASSSGGAPSTGGAGSASGGATSSGGAPSATGGAASGGRGVGSGGAVGTGGATSSTGGAPAGTTGGTNGGAGAGAGGAPMPSTGCGMATTDALNMLVRHNMDVGGTSREYYVRLPTGYDVNRAYPTIFLFHGAGSTGATTNGGQVPIAQSSGANAIIVAGTALVSATENRTQWQFTNASSPDVAFFDALLTQVGNTYCIDRSRVFAAGFSSGSWMSNLLGCVRRDKLRAYGVVSGGIVGNPTCVAGTYVAAWFLHDASDTENVIMGNITSRDRVLKNNGCGTTTVPDMPSPCVRYEGCRDGYPVDWCETTGAGHNVQGTISGPGLWRFFSSF